MADIFSSKIEISQYSFREIYCMTCYDVTFDVTFVIYSCFVWNYLKCFNTH